MWCEVPMSLLILKNDWISLLMKEWSCDWRSKTWRRVTEGVFTWRNGSKSRARVVEWLSFVFLCIIILGLFFCSLLFMYFFSGGGNKERWLSSSRCYDSGWKGLWERKVKVLLWELVGDISRDLMPSVCVYSFLREWVYSYVQFITGRFHRWVVCVLESATRQGICVLDHYRYLYNILTSSSEQHSRGIIRDLWYP